MSLESATMLKEIIMKHRNITINDQIMRAVFLKAQDIKCKSTQESVFLFQTIPAESPYDKDIYSGIKATYTPIKLDTPVFISMWVRNSSEDGPSAPVKAPKMEFQAFGVKTSHSGKALTSFFLAEVQKRVPNDIHPYIVVKTTRERPHYPPDSCKVQIKWAVTTPNTLRCAETLAGMFLEFVNRE